MQIAAAGCLQRVEVGMGVEPEHEEFAPRFRCAGDHGGERAGRQAVVAAEHADRHALAARLIGRHGDRLGPGDDLGERFDRRIAVRGGLQRGKGEVAAIDHAVAELGQRAGEMGDPMRLAPCLSEVAGALLHRRT